MKVPKNMDDVKELGVKCKDFCVAQFNAAKAAGLFDHFGNFFKDVTKPMPYEQFKDQAKMQKIVLAQATDLEESFKVALAMTVALEVVGAVFNFIVQVSLVFVLTETVYALIAPYVLYFMLLKSSVPSHPQMAFFSFVVLTLLSFWETFTSLVHILPVLPLAAKSISSAICTAYAYKIMVEKKKNPGDFVQLEELDEEKVAE